MTERMIVSSNGEFTFMYRVGGIAIHDGRLLVELNVPRGYCFVPGGRVEYGESAVTALARELREELGEEVEIGRLVLVADNLFEMDGIRYQEVAPYFMLKFNPGSDLLDRDGVFEGAEPGIKFRWVPLDEIEDANLFPPFLRDRLYQIPQVPEYIVHSDLGSPLA